MKSFITSFLVILSSMLVEFAMCEQKTFIWEVKYQSRSPDGVQKEVIAINGEFPGPTIRAKVGDNITVEVTNNLPVEGISIHWHGIRQYGTPWSDGTASISQCATPPREKFTYNFIVDRAGTFFYHAHNKMLRVDGCYGMLIVEDEQKLKVGDLWYDGELELLLSDWWHKNSTEQEDDLSSEPMIWVGEPQSLLMNGRGQYMCSMTSTQHCNFTGLEDYAPYVLRVNSTKTYRLRLASAASLASLNFAIKDHLLQVVEADGNVVEPFTVDNMNIFPGQSYSVLINATQDPSKPYWVSASVIARNPNTTQALTVLSYKVDETNITLPTKTPPPLAPAWNNTDLMKEFARKIRAKKGTPRPPSNYTVRLYLLNTQNRNRVNGSTKWAINNVSLVLPPTPYLGAIVNNLTSAFNQTSPPKNFDPNYDVMNPAKYPAAVTGDGVYWFKKDDVVDVVLQNANALKENTSETHPWHLHGHDFWVMGYGEKKFFDGDEKNFNLIDPPLRNTEVVFPFGWTVLRFKADNPGVWAFHCHIEPHMHMGMGVVFAEATDKLQNVPQEGLQCGLNK